MIVFRDAPIYMTAAALTEFERTSDAALAFQEGECAFGDPRKRTVPEALPTPILSVDGETVDVIQDFQGDVLKATNSSLWIPSLRAVIAGDIVFSGVHVWLGHSNSQSRRAWHDSLQLIAALHPLVVVAGHKKTSGLADSPRLVAAMERYLDDFEAARKSSTSPDELIEIMKRKYPDWVQEKLLVTSA
jgi:glyoxylase-like metal-dependent hydrolase (beta-lactamase superfamily II)